jgi:hypothetical protein
MDSCCISMLQEHGVKAKLQRKIEQVKHSFAGPTNSPSADCIIPVFSIFFNSEAKFERKLVLS